MTATDAPALAALRRFVRPRPVVRPGERCDFCDSDIAAIHSHMVDLPAQRLLCVCRACYLLFLPEGAGNGRYRVVPDRVVAAGPAFTDEQWEGVQIPVAVAFFFHSTPGGRTVAFYPSPAGAVESELPVAVWNDVVRTNRRAAALEPDVEALLVRRGEQGEAFVVPIDLCYELVGRLRRAWRGFDGGEEARAELSAFFDEVRARARTSGGRS